MELDPAYVDVAVTRWQAFTGEIATLDGDGRSFAEIAAERARRERGRRPKPTAIRRLEGNRGKRGLEPRRAGAARRHTALPRASRPAPPPSGAGSPGRCTPWAC